jgi:hypothetical protein
MVNWGLSNSVPIIFVLFFMLIGYLEGSWIGLVAGFILPFLSLLLINISLIPFVGVVIWYYSFTYLTNAIGRFIPIPLMVQQVIYFSLGLSIVLTTLTTIVSIIFIGLAVKYRGMFVKEGEEESLSFLDLKGLLTLDNKGLQDIINNIVNYITNLMDKISKKLAGSILFWFGLGIASHDFWWETNEAKPGEMRPTQGGYEGLNVALVGMQLIVWGSNLSDQIKKTWMFYLGYALSLFGFTLTIILPKGFNRIICHVLWWSGAGIMIYNWYILMKDELMQLSLKVK